MTTETRLYTEAEVKAEIDAALKIERKAILKTLTQGRKVFSDTNVCNSLQIILEEETA